MQVNEACLIGVSKQQPNVYRVTYSIGLNEQNFKKASNGGICATKSLNQNNSISHSRNRLWALGVFVY